GRFRHRLLADARLRACKALRSIGARQVQRERASGSRRADEPDLAAEQLGQLAADRKAEAGAAVLPRRGAVGLLERLEDDLLLVLRDADPGIAHREGKHVAGRIQL